jgi:hypothetical protein
MPEVLQRGSLIFQGSLCFAVLRNDSVRVFQRLKCIRSFQIRACSEVKVTGLALHITTNGQELVLSAASLQDLEQWKAALLGSVRMERHFSAIACATLREGEVVFKHSIKRRSKRFIWVDFSSRQLRWSRKNSKRNYSSFSLDDVKAVKYGGSLQIEEPSHSRVAIITSNKTLELEVSERTCEAWVVAFTAQLGIRGLTHSQFIFRKASLKLGDWSMEWPLAFKQRLLSSRSDISKMSSFDSSILTELPSEFESFSLPVFASDPSADELLQNTSRFPETWDNSADYLTLKEQNSQQLIYIRELEHALRCEKEANATLSHELSSRLGESGRRLQETERQHERAQLKVRLDKKQMSTEAAPTHRNDHSPRVRQGSQSAVRHSLRTLKLQVEELREEVVDQYEQFQEVWPHVVYLVKAFGPGLRRGKENLSPRRKSIV